MILGNPREGSKIQAYEQIIDQINIEFFKRSTNNFLQWPIIYKLLRTLAAVDEVRMEDPTSKAGKTKIHQLNRPNGQIKGSSFHLST